MTELHGDFTVREVLKALSEFEQDYQVYPDYKFHDEGSELFITLRLVKADKPYVVLTVHIPYCEDMYNVNRHQVKI